MNRTWYKISVFIFKILSKYFNKSISIWKYNKINKYIENYFSSNSFFAYSYAKKHSSNINYLNNTYIEMRNFLNNCVATNTIYNVSSIEKIMHEHEFDFFERQLIVDILKEVYSIDESVYDFVNVQKSLKDTNFNAKPENVKLPSKKRTTNKSKKSSYKKQSKK